MTYFNNTNLTGEELEKAQLAAKTQDEKVAIFFAIYPEDEFTGWEILGRVFPRTVTPFTSICRTLDTLHKKGVIEKTGNLIRSGPYDKKCFTWRLKKEEPEQLSLF